MDWKSLGEAVVKLGLPLLGAVLPIPGGAAIGTALASAIGSGSADPQAILNSLTASAEAAAKAKQFELQHQETMMKMQLDYEVQMRQADSTDIGAVNETMRAEYSNSATEAWYQKAWRPANGFAVAIGSLASVLYAGYLFYIGTAMHDPSAISMVPTLATSVATILAVPGAAVGIAAWHRGKQKIVEAQNATQKVSQ